MANDCCANMTHIEEFCGTNAAGFKTTINVQCKNQIAEIGAAVNNVVPTISGEFFQWNISPLDQTYTAVPEGDVDSKSILHTLSYFIPKMTPGVTHMMNSIIGGEKIIVFTDRNGEVYILGDLEEGARMDIQAQTNDKNGYVVTVTWTTNRYAYNFDGTLSIEGESA